MNEQATKKNFVQNSTSFGVLHLSTHASSGDFTIPTSIQFYDTTMFLNDLYTLDLNPNLVVLSACETGVGKLQKGEGAMSITRGFQYTGSQNILFSLWKINDQSSSVIIKYFYEIYSKHKSPHQANHQSKISYLNNSNISNSKKSPYYWGAFVYYGNVIPSTDSSDAHYNYVLTSLIILIFLLILFLRCWKKR